MTKQELIDKYQEKNQLLKNFKIELCKLLSESPEYEEQVKEIASIKWPDLNAYDLEAAIKTVKGTALNMGIEIK